MPRPKGSKNRKTATTIAPAATVEEIENKMSTISTEIEELGAQLKAKKAELKELTKQKLAVEAEAAAKKAEEDKAAILAAVEKSGKTVEEILELLK